MEQAQTIILCGGSINYSNLPIGTTQSNAMISVNGKPVIGWILDDLLEKEIREVSVVLREHDYRLKNFLLKVYSDRIGLRIVSLHHDGTIVQSLQNGLRDAQYQGPVRIILGDTLIKDSYTQPFDYVYVSEVDDPERWCLVVIDDQDCITEYLNKKDTDIEPKLALAGYYHLLDGAYLSTCVESSAARGDMDLSDVLVLYGLKYAIRTLQVDEWYDFGNIDNLVSARRRLLKPRHFNKLEIDPIFNTITKISENGEKLIQEINWYLALPEGLNILTPRILSYDIVAGQVKLVQEYYGYPTLAELSVYGELSVSVWNSILNRVFQVHDLFRKYPGQLATENLSNIYVDKTIERVRELCSQSTFWETLVSTEKICVNGRELLNFSHLVEFIHKQVAVLKSNAQTCIIHGDFCFSNILFDINNQIIRLIDPRGSFGQDGIFGDPRYDMAKLRHSVCGKYDFIIADMFDMVCISTSEFHVEVYDGMLSEGVCDHLDNLIVQYGYDLDEIRFIESLLFISMCPLHKENFKRQLLLYLTGVRLLNEVYQCALSST